MAACLPADPVPEKKTHFFAGTKPFEIYQIFIVNTRFLGFNRRITDAMANPVQIRHR